MPNHAEAFNNMGVAHVTLRILQKQEIASKRQLIFSPHMQKRKII